MLSQTKKLLLNLQYYKKRSLCFINHSPLIFLNFESFSDAKKIFSIKKDNTYLSKIKKQFQEAEKYIRKKNNIDKAIKSYQDILRSFNFGTELKASDGLQALIGVGNALVLQNKSNKALDYYLLALAFYPLNKSIEERADLCRKIAECYFEEGSFSDSLNYFQQALDLYKSLNVAESLFVGKIYMFLGKIYTHKNDPYQAMDFYRTALNILESNEENPFFIIQTKSELANLLALKKEQWAAWSTLYEAMVLYDQSTKLNYTERILINEQFIQVLEILGFYRELIERCKVLVELYRTETENFSNKKIIEMLANIAFTYVRVKDYAEAAEYYKQVLVELDKIDSEAMKGDILLQIGICCWSNDNYDEAKTFLYRAVNVKEEMFGPKNIDVGKAYYYLGRIYYSEWEYEISSTCLEKALEILKSNYDQDHEDIIEIKRYLNKVRHDMNEEE